MRRLAWAHIVGLWMLALLVVPTLAAWEYYKVRPQTLFPRLNGTDLNLLCLSWIVI